MKTCLPLSRRNLNPVYRSLLSYFCPRRPCRRALLPARVPSFWRAGIVRGHYWCGRVLRGLCQRHAPLIPVIQRHSCTPSSQYFSAYRREARFRRFQRRRHSRGSPSSCALSAHPPILPSFSAMATVVVELDNQGQVASRAGSYQERLAAMNVAPEAREAPRLQRKWLPITGVSQLRIVDEIKLLLAHRAAEVSHLTWRGSNTCTFSIVLATDKREI